MGSSIQGKLTGYLAGAIFGLLAGNASAQTIAPPPVSAPASTAGSCGTPVRLDDDGGSMAKVPVLDQKNLPICYAFSTAEMLDAWRCSHGASDCTTATVSPVAVSANAESIELSTKTVDPKKRDKQSAFWGYNPTQIQAATLFQGPYCNQAGIESIDQTNEFNTGVDHLFDLYQHTCITMPSFGSVNTVRRPSCRLMNSTPQSGGDGFDQFVNQSCSAISVLKNADQKLIEDALLQSNPLLLVKNKIDPTCAANPISMPKLPEMNFYKISPETGGEPDPNRMSAMKTAIDNEFNKMGKAGQPIFVGYCADALPAGKNFMPNYGKACLTGGHASLIIGRRAGPKGVCQYLVRNSWGNKCANDVQSKMYYSPDWECEPTKGDYWIDQDVMQKAAFEIGGAKGEGIGGLLPASMSSSTLPAQ